MTLAITPYNLFGHAITLESAPDVFGFSGHLQEKGFRLARTESWEIRYTLLRSLLPGLDNLEHLLLGDTSDLGQWYRKLGSFFVPLVLD
jgi:hypothetical protein